ncbi:MAG: asparagine synthetase B family protein, partial [Steroidobacteraceae bacterium]
GFAEAQFDEAPAARAVAKHLGTDHTELYVSPRQSLDVIPQLARIYDEPFADSSQIPTFLVSQLARQHVTVSLSGDGGDELFGGYGRYEQALHAWRGVDAVPAWARRAIHSAIVSVPVPALNALGSWLPRRLTEGRAGDRAHKAATRLSMRSFDELYRSLMSSWQQPELALHREVRRQLTEQRMEGTAVGPAFERMMASDLVRYLPNDVLVKVDRASMAVSLEGRMPLLDPRVIEFAWRLPHSLKRRDGTGKWLLRELLYRLVPRTLVDRPKRGFGVPIGSWLQHELRDWAGDLLSSEALMRDGLLDTQRITRMFHEHVTGRRSWTSQLWTALMFQAWMREHATRAV